MKSKLPWNHVRGKSNTSMDKPKDEFWDGMPNPAMSTGDESLSNPDITAGDDKPSSSIEPLAQTEGRVMEDIKESVLPGGQVAEKNTKVIEVQGNVNDDPNSDNISHPSTNN